jgi:hypothetical protein
MTFTDRQTKRILPNFTNVQQELVGTKKFKIEQTVRQFVLFLGLKSRSGKTEGVNHNFFYF